MRRNIELYIKGQRADIDAGTLVLMNYKQTDASAPAAVYNAWSQSVVLPRSNNNNRIFSHLERPDAVNRVNVFQREPFVIYNDRSEIVESGYFKVENVTPTQYNVTLYGGLGGFLFSLMYNADGTKKTLADLAFDYDLEFNINRDAVRSAWRRLAGMDGASMYDVVNFAPCYNGLPTGEFDAKKAFCPVGVYGVTGRQTEGADVYASRNGHVLVDLAEDVDEWAAADLRSYLQRPVLNIRALFRAISTAATAGGYSLNLDGAFFNDNNPYYNKTWLTLGRLDELTLPNASGGGSVNFAKSASWANSAYGTTNKVYRSIGTSTVFSHGATANTNAQTTIQACVNVGTSLYQTVLAWERNQPDGTKQYKRVVAAYQLVAFDASGMVVGGSRVAMATTKTNCTSTPMEATVTPAEFVRKFNQDATAGYDFAPVWLPDDGDIYEAAMYNGEYVDTDGVIKDASGNALNITLKLTDVVGVSSIRLYTTYLAITTSAANSYYVDQVTSIRKYNDLGTTITLNGLGNSAGTLSYNYTVSGNCRSGARVTQSLLLSGTQTPADYLLSFCKLFGLYIVYDRATKQVNILTRGNFYSGSDVDITDRVAVDTIKTVPAAITAHWYDFVTPAGGRFADYYKTAYGREYGLARYNTGYEFNATNNDVMSGNTYQGAAMSLHNNKYFIRVTQDGKECPAPFIFGGKYTLWKSDGTTKGYDIACPTDAATIDYINTAYMGYDYGDYIKPEFCDGSNKSKGGADVLLMFSGTSAAGKYSRYCITDDNGLMTRYNEGKPCWLLGQNTLAANAKYCINDGTTAANKLPYPVFTRWIDDYTLDMGTPAELDAPTGYVGANDGVFPRYWSAYMADLARTGARVITCKINLAGLFGTGADLLRNFYYYRGAYWVISQIKNYNVEGGTLAECELIQVTNKNAYTNGQTI